MKTKKRLLSILTCATLLVSLVPMGVNAAVSKKLTAETDGVAKYYEVKASNKEGSTYTQGPENNYYLIKAHNFCDVGDTSTVKFTDYSDGDYATSNVFTRLEIEAEDMSDVEGAIAEGWITHADNGICISYTFSEASERGTDFASKTYSYLFRINDKTYVLDENNELVESTTPKGCYLAYDDVAETTSKSGSCIIKLNNYNTIVGTTLKTEATTEADEIKLEDAKLDKVEYVIYKNGTKVETFNLGNVFNKKVATPVEPTYTVSFKLNADGSVTVDTDQTIMGYVKGSTDLMNIFEACTTNADGTRTIAASTVEVLDTIVIYCIGYYKHLYHVNIDVKNVSEILEYYKTSNINPDDIPDSEKPNTGDEDKKPTGGLIVEVPTGDDSNGDKEKPTTSEKPTTDKPITDKPTTTDKEETSTEETTTESNENETIVTDKEETTVEIKDVILTEDNKTISKDDMIALITENVTKNVIIKTPTGITLTFAKGTMKSVDGKEVYDFGVTISDDYSKHSDMGAITKDNFVSLIDYNYSGDLPAEAIIKIPVGTDRIGQTLYYLQKVGTDYTLIQSAKVDDEGYITVKQDHCSTYIVSTADVSEDNSLDKQNETEKTPDSNNVVIYVIITVIIVAIAGAVVFVVYKKKKTEQQNN